MSEDATYEDMVAHSKDIWNVAIAIGAVKYKKHFNQFTQSIHIVL